MLFCIATTNHTNPKLRAKNIKRVEVLDRVGALQTLPNSYASTTKQVAEYYGVKPQAINGVINLNRKEVQEAGARKAGYDNLKGRLFEVAGSTKAWTEMRYSLGIASGDTNLYPKQAVLLIGFMLEGSVVAMKIRNLVLEKDDVFYIPVEKEEEY